LPGISIKVLKNVPILGQNHWENLLQRFLREVSVKHLSGEIYAEVKVSVGFMETFFGKSPYEMEVLLGKYGKIIYTWRFKPTRNGEDVEF